MTVPLRLTLRQLQIFAAVARCGSTAAAGDELRAGDHKNIGYGALRHFGSWKAAVAMAGCELPSQMIWTAEEVLAQIRSDFGRGLSMRVSDVIARNQRLHPGGRFDGNISPGSRRSPGFFASD